MNLTPFLLCDPFSALPFRRRKMNLTPFLLSGATAAIGAMWVAGMWDKSAPPVPTESQPVSATPVHGPMTPQAFLAACRDQERELTKYFESEVVWWPHHRDELLIRLRIAGVVRPRQIIPVLLAHIAYEDESRRDSGRLPSLDDVCPVYGALRRYGPDVLEDLFLLLRRTEPITDEKQWQREASLYIFLLQGLSNNVTTGKRFARLRIEHEMAGWPKGTFPRLEALLAHDFLK